MVTITPHPHSRRGDSSFLLDLHVDTGSVPLDGFAIELLFHTEDMQITDVYMSDDFLQTDYTLGKKIDNIHGCLVVSCVGKQPYVVGKEGKVVATLCVQACEAARASFMVGERTQLYIHG